MKSWYLFCLLLGLCCKVSKKVVWARPHPNHVCAEKKESSLEAEIRVQNWGFEPGVLSVSEKKSVDALFGAD